MKSRLIAAALIAVFWGSFVGPQVKAQGAPTILPGGCGTGNLTNTGQPSLTEDQQGRLCISLGIATPGNEIVPNNATGVNLKAAGGSVWGVQLGGIGAAPVYVKLYDKATAPTCGTDTPVKRLLIPAAATAANGAVSNVPFTGGVKFANGIGFCVVTGIGDSDNTPPTATTYLVNIDWN